jgi:hypothetical protein
MPAQVEEASRALAKHSERWTDKRDHKLLGVAEGRISRGRDDVTGSRPCMRDTHGAGAHLAR